MKRLITLEKLILICGTIYEKNKQDFTFVVEPISSEDIWFKLQSEIKKNHLKLLEDVDEEDIAIKPDSWESAINNHKVFSTYLDFIPEYQNGIKKISFNVETGKYIISKIYFIAH